MAHIWRLGLFQPEELKLAPVFGMLKEPSGFTKLRYPGLEKNATRAFTALALTNIYLGRQKLLAQAHP